jgi:hypothetical protein
LKGLEMEPQPVYNVHMPRNLPNRVRLEARIKPATREALKALAVKLDLSEGQVIDRAIERMHQEETKGKTPAHED